MKNWQYRERARDVLAREVGYVRKAHGGRIRVALAFPNTYYVGMSSLGFQTVYRLFNDLDDVVCERVFLPAKQELQAQLEAGAPLLTLESQTPIGDFDVIAFSVSFEWDYTNVVTLLRLAGVAPRADARRPGDPLVVIGGAVTFVNPEPLALFADVIAAGEGEILIPALAAAIRAADDRDDLLRRLALERGFYIPSFYDVRYAGDGTIAAFEPRPGTGAPPVVKKAAVKSVDRLDPPATSIFTPDTEFGSRFLIEVVRGCANLCRFCWAGYNYLPVRSFPADRILELAAGAKQYSSKAGLVSIALCDHPEIERILTGLLDMGYSISPASLRLDDLTEPIVRLLRKSGERSITIAPETGSDRLRRVINKTVTNEEILAATELIFANEHREPEALLHDRPADGDGGGPRRHLRPDRGDAHDHDAARQSPRPRRTHRRQRQPAHSEARHGLSVAPDGRPRRDRCQGQAPAASAVASRQRVLQHQVGAAFVLPGAALAGRSARGLHDRGGRAQRREMARRRGGDGSRR